MTLVAKDTLKMLQGLVIIAVINSIASEITTECLEMFNQWSVSFSKVYESPEVTLKAVENFIASKELVEAHNLKLGASFRVGLWEKSDHTVKEITDALCGLKPEILKNIWARSLDDVVERSLSVLPVTQDWSWSLGPVRDQGYNCGSCWTFTAVAIIEAYYYIKYYDILTLSEQFLVDCVPFGCGGGHYYNGLKYVKDHGIVNSSYLYLDTQGTCPELDYSHLNITGFALFPSGDEEKLKIVVGTIGPVAVGFDAHLDTFVNYQSGIYYDSRCSSEDITHAILIVGYGTENGMDYWLIRNSWVSIFFKHFLQFLRLFVISTFKFLAGTFLG